MKWASWPRPCPCVLRMANACLFSQPLPTATPHSTMASRRSRALQERRSPSSTAQQSPPTVPHRLASPAMLLGPLEQVQRLADLGHVNVPRTAGRDGLTPGLAGVSYCDGCHKVLSLPCLRQLEYRSPKPKHAL